MHISQSEPPASSTQVVSESSGTNQFVTFACGSRAFGIEIMSVREIRSWSPTTELPGQPHGAKGVLDIRGSIVQVYDLAALIGAGRNGDATETGQVVLVVAVNDEEVGILVDSVSDIIFARTDDMRAVPSNGRQPGDSMVSALVKNEDRLIGILSLSALFPARSGNFD